jgi:hypothetical protein
MPAMASILAWITPSTRADAARDAGGEVPMLARARPFCAAVAMRSRARLSRPVVPAAGRAACAWMAATAYLPPARRSRRC